MFFSARERFPGEVNNFIREYDPTVVQPLLNLFLFFISPLPIVKEV